MEKTISLQTLQRLPTYLGYLKSLPQEGPLNVSAKQVANALALGEIQVRKDLAAASAGGKPKIGYIIKDLILDIERYLGYDDINDAVLVGAGKLGKALLFYEGFRKYGLNIVAAFDIDRTAAGSDSDSKKILPLEKMQDLCRRMKIRIGIITVPAEQSQSVCDLLVNSGILAIWNFTPVHVTAPDNILIKNENMAASLAVFSRHLSEKIHAGI